jgi:hypothetical protein
MIKLAYLPRNSKRSSGPQKDRLFTMDTKVINHILMNNMDYPKPEPTRYGLSRILGNGTSHFQAVPILIFTFFVF